MVPVSLSNVIRGVKILALAAPGLNDVISLIKCFPCVEKLYMTNPRGNSEGAEWSAPFECLDLHLKMLEVAFYDEKSSVSFVKFFVFNARKLESIKLVVRRLECATRWINRQLTRLQLKNSASHSVRVDFRSDMGMHFFIHKKHIHDLAVGDPYDSSLCRCRQ